MKTAYLDSLRESINRRTASVLAGLGILIGVLFNFVIHLQTAADGSLSVVVGTQSLGNPKNAVPFVLGALVSQAGSVWMLLALLGSTALLVSCLEKGWVEILFTKYVPGNQIFLARYLGGITIYVATFFLAASPVAIRLWLQTEVSTLPIFLGLFLQTLSFAGILSVAAFATLTRGGITLPVMASAAIWLLSPLLQKRATLYYPFVSSEVGRGAVDWIYRILPKCAELDNLAAAMIQGGHVQSWWPVWSTACFTLITLTGTLLLLRRKSF